MTVRSPAAQLAAVSRQGKEKTTLEFHILLFDLIGVLVKDSERITQEILEAANMSEEELVEFWITSPTIRNFETGRTSIREFGVNMVRDLELSSVHPNSWSYSEVGLGDCTTALRRCSANSLIRID